MSAAMWAAVPSTLPARIVTVTGAGALAAATSVRSPESDDGGAAPGLSGRDVSPACGGQQLAPPLQEQGELADIAGVRGDAEASKSSFDFQVIEKLAQHALVGQRHHTSMRIIGRGGNNTGDSPAIE